MEQTQEMIFCDKKEIILTEEQVRNINIIEAWAKDKNPDSKQTLSMAGPAGTGKTVTIAAIEDRLSDIHVGIVAFTGKAVSVLRRKGIFTAATLHSTMYSYNEFTGEFVRRNSIPHQMYVVDEGSMIDVELNRDLLSFGKKVLYVGDPYQLEPIGDNPNLMRNADLQLTTIHRQALQSPIIVFSIILRDGQEFDYGSIGEEISIVPDRDFWDYVPTVDQVICGYNSTRHLVNKRVRSIKEFNDILNIGDRVICLKNNMQIGVFNGLMGTVESIKEISGRYIYATVVDELGVRHTDLKMNREQFGSNNREFKSNDKKVTFWDYGYCITCHKAQGSEWDSVLVKQEFHENWDPKRWAYTAATRASKRLVYAC